MLVNTKQRQLIKYYVIVIYQLWEIKLLPYKNIKVTPEREGQRIDNFLVVHLKNIPKSRIYKMIRTGEVRVNKGRVKPSYRLCADDYIRLPPTINNKVEKTNAIKQNPNLFNKILNNAILYEDEQVVIINKPHGLAVHGGSGLSYGLIELLRQHWSKYKELELVHRLDRDTSGCIIVAKKRSTLKALHKMLREGDIYKQYSAIIQGILTKERLIEAPLKKYTLSSGERLVKVDHAAGLYAATKFKPIKHYLQANATLVELEPITGKTHQIRVHAAQIKHPIAGDEKYGNKDFNKYMKIYGLNRLFLHAKLLKFKCTKTEQLLSVIAPCDKVLTQVLTCLEKGININD